MTDSQQQARAILDQLAFMAFEQCLSIDRQFTHLPARPGMYAIRHRTEGVLLNSRIGAASARGSQPAAATIA